MAKEPSAKAACVGWSCFGPWNFVSDPLIDDMLSSKSCEGVTSAEEISDKCEVEVGALVDTHGVVVADAPELHPKGQGEFGSEPPTLISSFFWPPRENLDRALFSGGAVFGLLGER